MSLSERLLARAGAGERGIRRVAFPEGSDTRVRDAASRLQTLGICQPLFVDEDTPVPDRYASLYVEQRGKGRMESARRRLQRPHYHAAMMVAAGDADALVAGAVLSTRQVLEAAQLCIGTPGAPSSCFLMDVPGRDEPLVFADCAVNVAPDAATLADIAIASAASAQRILGLSPRVAFLSFSTLGSGAHSSVDTVREAVADVQRRAPDLQVAGELQADTALNAAVAARKVGSDVAVAGNANVLIFPDLNSGNIAYKLVQQLAGAQAVGPLLQGFNKPVADLSRGADVEEIVITTAATLC